MQNLTREPDTGTDETRVAEDDMTKDLEFQRQIMVQTVLRIRARYERAYTPPGTGNAARERQLLSAAVKDLEELDACLHALRGCHVQADTCPPRRRRGHTEEEN